MKVNTAANIEVDTDAKTVTVKGIVYPLVRTGSGWMTQHPETQQIIHITLVADPRGGHGWLVQAAPGPGAIVGRSWVEGCAKAGVSPMP